MPVLPRHYVLADPAGCQAHVLERLHRIKQLGGGGIEVRVMRDVLSEVTVRGDAWFLGLGRDGRADTVVEDDAEVRQAEVCHRVNEASLSERAWGISGVLQKNC